MYTAKDFRTTTISHPGSGQPYSKGDDTGGSTPSSRSGMPGLSKAWAGFDGIQYLKAYSRLRGILALLYRGAAETYTSTLILIALLELRASSRYLISTRLWPALS